MTDPLPPASPASHPSPDPRGALIDARFVEYQRGLRTAPGLVPVMLVAASMPLVAATSWGAPRLGFTPLTYALAASAFVLAVAWAWRCHRHHGSLSPAALRAERLESCASITLSALWVLGPGEVLHLGWIAFVIHGLNAAPLRWKQPDALWTFYGVLALTVALFGARGGVGAAAGAGVLAAVCLLPLHPLLSQGSRNLDAELAGQQTAVALERAQIALAATPPSAPVYGRLSAWLGDLRWHLRALPNGADATEVAALTAQVERCLALLGAVSDGIDEAQTTSGALADRVRARLQGLGGGVPIEVRVPATEDARPLPAQSAAVLLSVAEALTHNALRHSGAAHIAVLVGPGLRVTVTDDGAASAPSWGEDERIFELRHRLGALGGALHLVALPGGGTVAEARLAA